jgi:hypothetical protein
MALTAAEQTRRRELAVAAVAMQRDIDQAVARAANGAAYQTEQAEQAAPIAASRPPPAAAAMPAFDSDGAPIDRWVCDATGLLRWRPIIDRLEIVALPDDSRLVQGSGIKLRLMPGEALHIALLLLPAHLRDLVQGALAADAAGVAA